MPRAMLAGNWGRAVAPDETPAIAAVPVDTAAKAHNVANAYAPARRLIRPIEFMPHFPSVGSRTGSAPETLIRAIRQLVPQLRRLVHKLFVNASQEESFACKYAPLWPFKEQQ